MPTQRDNPTITYRIARPDPFVVVYDEASGRLDPEAWSAPEGNSVFSETEIRAITERIERLTAGDIYMGTTSANNGLAFQPKENKMLRIDFKHLDMGVKREIQFRSHLEDAQRLLEFVLGWAPEHPNHTLDMNEVVKNIRKLANEYDFPYRQAAIDFEKKFPHNKFNLAICWLTGQIIIASNAFSIYKGFLKYDLHQYNNMFAYLNDKDYYVVKGDTAHKPIRLSGNWWSQEYYEEHKDEWEMDEFIGEYVNKRFSKNTVMFRGQKRYKECPISGHYIFDRIEGDIGDTTMTGYPRELAAWRNGGRNTPRWALGPDPALEGVEFLAAVSNYSVKAEHIFGFLDKGKPPTRTPQKGKMYYGFEIELEKIPDEKLGFNEITQLERKLLEIGWIMTRDGSLREGIEFKSAPMTYTYAEESLKKLYALIDTLPLRSTSRCGTHVHVSRSELSECQVARILSLIYRQANSDFIQLLAGRESGEYQEYASQQGLTVTKELKRRTSTGVRRDEDGKLLCAGKNRYTAVNLTGNNTVEFRLFSGAPNLIKAQTVLQTVRAILEYTQPSNTPFNLREISVFSNFVDWLGENGNRKMFPYLASTLGVPTKRKGKKKRCA